MSTQELERRVKVLEKKVADLEQKLQEQPENTIQFAKYLSGSDANGAFSLAPGTQIVLEGCKSSHT